MPDHCHDATSTDPVVHWRFVSGPATGSVAHMTVRHEVEDATRDHDLAEDVALAVVLLLEGVAPGTGAALRVWCSRSAVDVRLRLEADDVAVDPDVEALVGGLAVERADGGVAVELCCPVRSRSRR